MHIKYKTQSKTNQKQSDQMASIFITHGGGPMPLIYKDKHQAMHKTLQQLGLKYSSSQIKAIIIFSAHWEEQEFTILDDDAPQLYFDYHGFPKESYQYKYPAKSTQELRDHIRQSLEKEGVQLKTVKKRGYDHGVFIPLMIMYPKADIPVIQISIRKNLNPSIHFGLGQALQNLKKQGFLIIGSGSSTHGSFGHPKLTEWSLSFEKDLQQRIKSAKTTADLVQISQNWKKLQFADKMHPREEHFVPLFINLGAADGVSKERYSEAMFGITVSNYVFS